LVEAGNDDHAELVQKIFGAWLNATRLHGCVFAGWAVRQRRIRFASFFDPPDDVVISQLTHHIELAESQSQLALAVFPGVVTEEQLFHLIELFRKGSRWSLRSVDVVDRYAVDLRWLRPGSEDASAIGFAPLGTMPVTRRAPYVAVGVWSKGHENPMRTKPDNFIGVGDMSHDLDEVQYKQMHKTTRAQVSRTRTVMADDAISTGVTFCLNASVDKLRAR
jgi:hypothetical protein